MLKLYGLKLSYFTGKLEGYLRYKGIPHEYCSMTGSHFKDLVLEQTGAMQMPAVELPDGRWMTDTSPMIDWFEDQYPEHPVLPLDPVQAFVCRLIEDYADEWLWRPAMHFRWSYPASSKLLSRQIADEMGKEIRLPGWLKRWQIEKRQHSNFVLKDGVTPKTRDHVEQGYTRLLAILETVFQNRPFVFGDRPTLADFGLFGPLFRHFSQDPVPAVIMRETAPAVSEWVHRLWNARGSRLDGTLVSGIPDDLLPLLREAGETHLENLCANAQAWAAKDASYGVVLQGTEYVDVPTSRYRVWCLEKLQERFGALNTLSQDELKHLLEQEGCLEPLLRIANPGSLYDPVNKAPFGRSIAVYENVKG